MNAVLLLREKEVRQSKSMIKTPLLQSFRVQGNRYDDITVLERRKIATLGDFQQCGQCCGIKTVLELMQQMTQGFRIIGKGPSHAVLRSTTQTPFTYMIPPAAFRKISATDTAQGGADIDDRSQTRPAYGLLLRGKPAVTNPA
jgi:hypothetical protein